MRSEVERILQKILTPWTVDPVTYTFYLRNIFLASEKLVIIVAAVTPRRSRLTDRLCN